MRKDTDTFNANKDYKLTTVTFISTLEFSRKNYVA